MLLLKNGARESGRNSTMLRKCDCIDRIDNPHQRYIAPFDAAGDIGNRIRRYLQATAGKQLFQKHPGQHVVWLFQREDGRCRQPRCKVWQAHLPDRGGRKRNDEKRSALFLSKVPAMENVCFLVKLGIVDQGSTCLGGKDSTKQRTSRFSGTGQDGGAYRPTSRAIDPIDRKPVCSSDDETFGILWRGPVERQGNLAPWPLRLMRSVPLPSCTLTPRAERADFSAAKSPVNDTRMTETPPSARLPVETDLTPVMLRTVPSVLLTDATSGVSY